MSRRLVAGLVALVALGGVFAYGLSKQGDVAKIDTTHVVVPPSGFQPFAAASIAGSTLDGKPFAFASLRGKPAFINFWGSWCPGCKIEAPDLRRFADGLGSQATMVGVALMGLNYRSALVVIRSAECVPTGANRDSGRLLDP